MLFFISRNNKLSKYVGISEYSTYLHITKRILKCYQVIITSSMQLNEHDKRMPDVRASLVECNGPYKFQFAIILLG